MVTDDCDAHQTRAVSERFHEGLDARWHQLRLGGGTVACVESGLRLALPAVASGIYADAQIDDYTSLSRSQFPWRPPLRMRVRARASHTANVTVGQRDAGQSGLGGMDAAQQSLRGTAGFGFWNYPFSPTGAVLGLPDAVWFFAASPPSNMALVPGVAGWGWKAQVVHAQRLGALVAVPPTLASMAWARLSGDARWAERWVQRLSGAAEVELAGADLRVWHEYSLEWTAQQARFSVDGIEVLLVPQPPRGPLGFVAWIDNQFAVATPGGRLRFGTVASESQWLDLQSLQIEPL